MGHDEKIWLHHYTGPDVLFRRRYVDDTFCLFRNEHDAFSVFDLITLDTPILGLPCMEQATKNRLPFLDISIDNNYSPAITTVYRKNRTFTSLLAEVSDSEKRERPLPAPDALFDVAADQKSKLTGFQNRFRLTSNARALLGHMLTIIEPTVDYSFNFRWSYKIDYFKISRTQHQFRGK